MSLFTITFDVYVNAVLQLAKCVFLGGFNQGILTFWLLSLGAVKRNIARREATSLSPGSHFPEEITQ